MGYEVKVLADSVSTMGARLTTLAVTLPRIVLAELNTHKALSRNSASSRAVPVQRMVERVMEDPFVPVYWGKNQAGMQAREELSATSIDKATAEWLYARDRAVESVLRMVEIGAHKQIANRLLEPWLWTTVIVTATDWQNFFTLRCHPDAQPELRRAAELMRDARDASEPRVLYPGQWHLPLVDLDDELALPLPAWDVARGPQLAEVSAARCARVSYFRHEERRNLQDDREFTSRLVASGHWSPLEHPAVALEDPLQRCGNMVGWRQLRKVFPGESGEPERARCGSCGVAFPLLDAESACAGCALREPTPAT